MIKDLAASYVKQKESLILVTISMKGNELPGNVVTRLDDIDNQQAYSISREHDPLGKRTIGTAPVDTESLIYYRGAHEA